MKSAICAISRNENNYLEEWITYHLHLGFNHIFIYDNNNPDDNSTPQFCSIQSWKEQVTVIDYRANSPHSSSLITIVIQPIQRNSTG